jgi:hypothetical protein
MESAAMIVAGGINIDTTTPVYRLPRDGETNFTRGASFGVQLEAFFQIG